MKKTLYSWQEECLQLWFANGGRGIVQAVTGSGKTRLALEAAAQLENKTGKKVFVKIIVPTASLMRQWNQALREFLGNQTGLQTEIGLRGGGYKSQTDCRYMIYVINSARYELARKILEELNQEKQVLLIADECHHYASGENQLIFEFLPYISEQKSQFYSMGLSATLPSGTQKNILCSFLGRCIYNYGISKALEKEIICRYEVYHIEVPLMCGEREKYEELTDHMKLLYRKIIKENPELKGRTQKELYEVLRRISGDKKSLMAKNAALYLNLSFKRKETVCLAEARNKCAVRLIELLGVGRKIIVFGERISQAEELYKTLQQYFPGKIGRYHSKMGEQANKNTIERFRVGEIRVLIACKSMDEGINISDISVGIVLSGTAGQRQRMQRLGRIVRRADGKDYASLYYLHAAETSEEQCFLPSITENSVHELKYDLDNDDFFHEAYDKLAEKVYEKMCQKDASTEMKQEIIRCLCKGSICSDWKKGITEIQRHIEEAESIRDRNYWICMLKLNET